jgi:hypothetical protein
MPSQDIRISSVSNDHCFAAEPYTPSPEEVANPKLFAENVRKVRKQKKIQILN